MKKKICIITSTRAEYGLLKLLIDKLSISKNFILKLIVTGMHLSTEFGLTYKLIEKDGVKIHKKIEILLSSDTSVGISKSMGLALISFSEFFDLEKPDMVLILGDRYEILSTAIAATLNKIPIAHIHGGESTEGAYDEAFRHCITKMSYIHFTSTETYKNRVIQLGEDPGRVFNVGALGVENIKVTNLLKLEELENLIDFKLDMPYALITYHPTTLENFTCYSQINELLNALDSIKNMKFIFTKCNSDVESNLINNLIENYCKKNKHKAKIFTTLGQTLYLSALKYSSLVIGNSSSGIIEAPSFKTPTINIGDRQNGRIYAESVINTSPNSSDIINSINKGFSNEFRASIKEINNPYDGGDTSNKIIEIIYKTLESPINIKKKFYDL